MLNVMNLLLVFCTFPSREVARQIGTNLIEAQLAACVNLCPQIESIYRWKGAIETSEEVLAVFKTSPSVYAAFEKQLSDWHPYDVPEIVAVKPEAVSEAYLAWAVNEMGLQKSN